jgi:hypothetical protein
MEAVSILAILQDGDPFKVRRAKMLRRQQHFVDKLGHVIKTVAQFGGNRKKKVLLTKGLHINFQS